MTSSNDWEDMERIKEEAMSDFAQTLRELERSHPKVVEGVAAAVGGSLGATASFTALFYGGSTVGLSAAGLTSGLAAAGSFVGGGMAAGVVVLAAPVAALAVCGYAIAKRRRNAKLTAALRTAIDKLHRIQERLVANAEYFKEQLAEVKAWIDQLEKRMPSLGEGRQKTTAR